MTPFATTLAPWQVAQLWADFEDAYAGRCSYGSDTFECYAYRLLPYDPLLASALARTRTPGDEETIRDNAKLARDALVSVARAFEEHRECKVFVQGANLDVFVTGPGFTHRVPVRVQK